MKKILLITTLVAIVVAGILFLPGITGNVRQGKYVFIKEYITEICVGGVVGITLGTFYVGETFWGSEVTDGIKIKVAPRSPNRGDMDWEEFIVVPKEYVQLVTRKNYIFYQLFK